MKPADILNKLFQPISIDPTEVVDNTKADTPMSKYMNILSSSMGNGSKTVESRLNAMNSRKLKQLSNQDPVIWSIKKTRKDQVTQQKWDIVPDLDKSYADLDRWEQLEIRNLNDYGFIEEFKPTVLTPKTVKRIQEEIIKSIRSNKDKIQAKAQIKFLFDMIKNELKQDADIHACIVKETFNRPNNTQTSFEAFLKLIVDDILTFDAGIIVKNKNVSGTHLAELYTIPGQDVKIIKNEDGSTPEAPKPAYVYQPRNMDVKNAKKFTVDELLYIVDNPQHTGYGMSPLEVAVLIITASLYAENYNMDFLKHSNIPPGILNLGKGVTEENRKIFQSLWDAEIAGKGGLHKLLFAAGSDHMEMIPLKQLSNKDMEMMEYLKWTLSIKCMCYSISPQDIGFTQDFHRTTAEVQKELSKSKGLKNLLSLLQSYINSEIVKTEWNFTDVKFKWLDVDLADAMEQAKIDHLDIKTGVISINERRKNRGDSKPIEGGDEHYVYTGKGLGVAEGLSIEEMHAQKQTGLAQDAGKEDDPNDDPNKVKDEDKNKDSKNNDDDDSKDDSKSVSTKKLEKYDHHTESYIVNAGTVIKTLDQFQEVLGSLLAEEDGE